MSATVITKENFESIVLKTDKTVLIDFYAGWCAPCRTVSPIVDEISDEASDKVIGKVNVDEQPELASAFRVASIPTLVVIKDGEVKNRSVGAVSKAKILELLNV